MAEWSDEDRAQIVEMFNAGMSASAISQSLPGKRSRNSIAGELYRLGLKRGEERSTIIHKNRSTHKRHREEAGIEPKISVKEYIEVSLAEPPTEYATPLLDLQKNQCRYIIDDKVLCCGQMTYRDYQYCVRHCRISYPMMCFEESPIPAERT